MPFVVLIVGLIVGGMCALLALNTASAANELQRHGYADADQSVAAAVAELENQVAASAAPGNIAAAAARLGMVPAGNPAFLVIRADGSVRLMGSPAPATGYPTYVPPRPSTSAKKTPARTSAPASPTKSAASPGRGRHATATPSAKPKPKPTPTPTPTPNTTLPGGDR